MQQRTSQVSDFLLPWVTTATKQIYRHGLARPARHFLAEVRKAAVPVSVNGRAAFCCIGEDSAILMAHNKGVADKRATSEQGAP